MCWRYFDKTKDNSNEKKQVLTHVNAFLTHFKKNGNKATNKKSYGGCLIT